MFPLIILYLLVAVNADSQSPVVKISSGLIEGQLISSPVINKTYYSFRGIPYAEAPVSTLRFQPPEERGPWTKTLETNVDKSKCAQKGGGSEDCLFLNIYTPNLPSAKEKSKLLPVMAYVHGGAFTHGSSSSLYYGPDYLMDKDIVLIVMNYRLNIFGFLNAMDELAPGNIGLKDQVAALKFIQENIKQFNGDPNKVTIVGHSAGSASVQYLTQSKFTKGLFHRAIMQSGSSLNGWALERNPLELIHRLGKFLNIKSENVIDIVNKIKELGTSEILNASLNNAVLNFKPTLNYQRFVPSLEYESPKSFQSKSSYSILENNEINSVPMIIGHTSNEAAFFLKDIKNGVIKLEEYEKNLSYVVSKSLNIHNDSDAIKSVANEIKNHYFNGVPFTNKSSYMKFESDESFARGIRKAIELLRKNNDIYYYIFDYKKKSDLSEYSGVPHVGELKYIFYTGVDESAEEKLIREKMTTLWANFVKTGNPTPKEDQILDNVIWPLVSRSDDKIKYLDIKEHLKISENPNQQNFEFWERIFKKYGKAPFYTY